MYGTGLCGEVEGTVLVFVGRLRVRYWPLWEVEGTVLAFVGRLSVR